ncbi:MAG TPA: DUF1638 domain-containing protein [Kiritimatiellia bacterium]|nr:DUF1638 domain-containing protein [Kiritimatiellia bacterium]
MTPPPPRIGLIACSVFESELAAHGAPPPAEIRWHEIALHDRPDVLRARLQESINELDAREDLDAVALLYGLCGRGTAGLRAGRLPLVIPRAHDCITVFLGSRAAFARENDGTTYFYTPGWNRARRVPGPDREAWLREDLAKRFEPDDVEFLLESERTTWTHYQRAAFIDLGTPDADAEADYAKRCADALGWRYDRFAGDPALLQDLLAGNWDDERFLVTPPHGELRHTPTDRIFAVKESP